MRKADRGAFWNLEGNQTLKMLGYLIYDDCSFVKDHEVQLRSWLAGFKDVEILDVGSNFSDV